MTGRGRRVLDLAGVTVLMAAALASTQPRAQGTSLHVYVFDGGTLGGRSAIVSYLVVHPRGSLLWDAGTIPDRLIESHASGDALPALVRSFNATADTTLRSQLKEAGYTPERITYFAASHYHFDHIANAGDYSRATWLVQKTERDAMFGGGPPLFGAEPAYYAPLKDAKTILLNGDHDVFGDGSVLIKSTPGHTPGHQCLFLKLARTGPVLLGGDVYHAPAERQQIEETIPAFDYDKAQSLTTRRAVEAFLKQTGAALWIEHDLALFRSQKKSPQFYE